ncbi:hypothetical protein DAX90_24840 [Salmonella enterica subsp. enterica]|uniref:Uncharacterized protein n=4 Tax=Salmonella enterica TaxID=28901 RepID=A0A8E9ZDS7_SALER|nr:hypothetical protein [Salmonella enterica]EEJ1962764.1 hypothetical protein [Salmonella enterica]PUF02088.1 hypothetical protein DAX90_24840 [Salmonella enterica subsp. enterica]QWJ65450.1 hypothetical protein A7R87_002270 [Salmonella enterica]
MNKLNSGLTASGITQPEISKAEATPEGIRIVYSANAVCANSEKLVAYKKAVTWLDKGRYDYDPLSGYRIAAAFLVGVDNGYLPFSDAGAMAAYRWIVSVIYFGEQAHKNGVIDVPDRTGGTCKAAIYKGRHASITVYPLQLRTLLDDAFEATVFKQYGRKGGTKVVIMALVNMFNPDGDSFVMSPFGNEVFSRMLEQLILHLKNSRDGNGGNNEPVKPVIH